MSKSPASHSNIDQDVDPLDTSVGLQLGFLGAMVATAVALATGTTTAEWPWFTVIATITAVTSRKSGILWAAYNGLVGAFFFNFMRPPVRRLAFDTVPSVIFGAGFIAIALTGNYLWRWWHTRTAMPTDHGTATPAAWRRPAPTLHLTPRQRERIEQRWPNGSDTD